jgi:Uncharacterised protein family (UPF0182)
MFEIAYLSLVVLVALPLAGSLLRRSAGEAISVHRLYRHAAYIAIAILAVICFDAALRISLENYWFAELGQSHRFWLSIEYRVGIFLVMLFLVGLFVGVNLWLAKLNFGDRFAYALAKTASEPLLFIGADFGHTDIVSAIA